MINEYENLLRSIIIDFLGSDSSKYKISEDRINKWGDKLIEETKKNNGICYENRHIYYSDFYDLETIISKNWEILKPVFKDDKKRFTVLFKEVESYRNTIAHGRTLTKSQLLLLEGILLDQKNLKTIYHNKNEMKDDYFIRINRVNDNLGNIWTSSSYSANPILRVDDEYELLIDATDPKDREIEYKINITPGNLTIKQKTNRFNFRITKGLIYHYSTVLITATTPNSEYLNKDSLVIKLQILPKK